MLLTIFTEYLDSIYYPGYALELAQDPEVFNQWFNEFQENIIPLSAETVADPNLASE